MNAYKFAYEGAVFGYTVKGVIEITNKSRPRFGSDANPYRVDIPKWIKHDNTEQIILESKVVGKIGCSDVHKYNGKYFVTASCGSLFFCWNKAQLLKRYRIMAEKANKYYDGDTEEQKLYEEMKEILNGS